MNKGALNRLVFVLVICLLTPALALAQTGTFTGTSVGRNGDIAVELKLSDGQIEAVTVTRHQETPGLSDGAIERMPQLIVEHQSVALDAVAGATITSNAILEAAKSALTNAGVDVATFSVEPEKVVSAETVELEADVVVVGGGAAGMACAVSAAQNGAQSVIVLEKQGNIGGNAIISGGFLEYAGAPAALLPDNTPGYMQAVDDLLAQDFSDNPFMSQWQARVKEDYAQYKSSGVDHVFDSPELMAMQYHLLKLGRPDETLMGYAAKCQAVCEWFGEMGVEWAELRTIVGFPWPRWTYIPGATAGQGYFSALQDEIERKNLPVTIMTETTGQALITENESVRGVVAQDRDGTAYNVRAQRAVVLATGGFSSNGEMLVEYNTQFNLTADVNSTNTPAQTGDGIRMAQALGAGSALMDQYMFFPITNPNNGSMTGGIAGDLYVNREGDRFVDESLDRNTISGAIFNQPGGICYVIADAPKSSADGVTLHDGTPVAFAMEQGRLFRGETIEELAQNMGADPEKLKHSVAVYNQGVETCEDPDFGRTAFTPGTQIVTGPFYASAGAPAVHITLGGLTVDSNDQVVRLDGTTIENLYAVGEITAGGAALSSFADGMMLGTRLVK